MSLFDDRSHAGRELSNFLKEQAKIDIVIIPYEEAFDVGLEIARRHNAELDVMISDFIYAPDIPYADIGAVTEDGTLWVEDRIVKELDVSRSHIEDTARKTEDSMKDMSMDIDHEIDKSGKNVLIASEGLGSGFREAAVTGSLLKQGVENVFLATPFKSRDVMADIESVVDELYYLKEIPFLSSANSCYKQNKKDLKIGQYNPQKMR